MNERINPDHQADLLAGVLDSSLDGIMLFSSVHDGQSAIADFKIEFVNRKCEEIVGRTTAELIGHTMLEVFPGNKEDGLFDAYIRVVETGEPFYTEHHYAHDGLNHWFSIKAAKCGEGFTVSFSDITAQKTSEERFRVLFEASTDAHLLFDETGIIDCNQAAVDMLGYDDKQAMLQVHPAELSPRLQPDGRRSMEKCIEMDRTARDQGFHRFDWMHRRKDGTDIPVEVTLNPVKLSGKDALLVVWHDLTERARAERAVRDAVDTLNEAQQLANIGNWQWTVADNKITWSDQVKRMFGMPVDQPAPSFEAHCKQIHPDDLAHWKAVLDKADRDHQPYTMTFRNLLPNGESRVLESRGRCELDANGELVRTYGTVQDITEAEATRDRLEKLSLVASRTDNSVVLMDAVGRITWVNRAFSTLSGYDEAEVVGKRPPDIFQGPDTDPAVIARIRHNLQLGSSFSETLLKYRKDGSTYWSEIEVQPIRDDHSQITHFMAIERDVTERIEQQKELEAQRQRLEFALQASRSGLWDWRVGTEQTYFSETWYTMLGYQPGELPMSLQSWVDLTEPEDLKRAMAALDEYFEGKTDRYTCEIRVRNKAGEWQWVLDVGEAVERDEQGNVTRMAGLHVDIHEQKIAQIQLEDQRHRLDFSLQTSRTGLWDWYVNDGQAFFSDTWYTMLGYRPGEMPMTFQTWESLAHPEDLPRAKALLNEYLAGQADRFACEMRLRNKVGQWQWINTIGQAALRDADGSITRIVGAHLDIHDQKMAQIELESQQHRLDFALQASRTGLWDWNIVTGESELSDTWYTMLGYTPGELPPGVSQAQELAHPDDYVIAKQRTEDYLAGRSARYIGEMRYKNSAGQWQWVMDVGEAVERDDAGNITRMVGLNIDIDQQKRTQDQLTQARDQAQQASAAKSAFVANMSHEIRTPMNAILGYADLLLDGGQTNADKRNHAQTIRRSGKHLMGILDDILDLSKIEAGKMGMEWVTCAPAELFQDVMDLMTPKADKKGIVLDFHADGRLPDQMSSDPTRIRQVLINLIGNAIKFTEQGRVRLTARIESIAEGEMGLCCEVSDTGIGISPGQMNQLFKPFSQADESTTRRFGGTGLGLTICARLCQMLGGELTCNSTPGQGTTFTARFRVRPAPARTAAKPSRPTPSYASASDALHNTRILIVEDSPDNQRLFQHYITKAGATAELAENGADGKDAALAAVDAGTPFDIVLMDMQMPVLDGYNATQQLRATGYDRPIIALTAHASLDDREKCLAAGCTDYLSKPVDRQQLIRTIAEHLCTTH